MKAGVFEDFGKQLPVGEYKNRKNIVSDIETVLPKDVPGKMRELIQEYEGAPKNLEEIMKYHAAFEKIHPFQDGDGRVGRMLIYKECLRNGIMPLIIENERKIEYYHFLKCCTAPRGIWLGLTILQKKNRNAMRCMLLIFCTRRKNK